MACYRVTMSFPVDSALARDRVQITPHFGGDNPDALLTALKNNLDAWAPTAGKPYTLTAYDALKPPPSYPLAMRENGGTTPSTSCPREVALCLSYYSTYNRPRYRGRLYLPVHWLSSGPPIRPSAAVITNALSFATQVLSKSLPSAHNWCVFSKLTGNFYGVSHAWVDDEWDTVRSRGMRSTTRQLVQIA